MTTRQQKSYCRICQGLCGMVLTVDENERIVSIRGDKDHPMTRGYACFKGLQAVEMHYGENRLLHPLKRTPDGSFVRIPLEQALDEIAEKLQVILDRGDPDAVAAFRGTVAFFNSTASRMVQDWLQSLGSRSLFTTLSIDQSAKSVTRERLGAWGAGAQSFLDADVWLLAGSNPLLSLGAVQITSNPALVIKEAKARGMKLIVIDPRKTETARHADLFLQIRPGEDPTVAAGLLRIILDEGWEDKAFCARYANDVAGLRRAIDPFSPEYVERRAGVPRAKLREAAELFARLSGRGIANTGTGPCMAPHSNLADHLYSCMNVICGRYPRAGERVRNPGVLSRHAYRAEAIAPRRSWESGYRNRIRNTGMLFGEKMTGTLADEILTPGEGQVRSLFVVGGNPVSAIPDQRKVVEAMQALDLLVTIDPYMTTTARLSHYVIPPRVLYEQACVGPMLPETVFLTKPLVAYTPGIVPPPSGSELVEDWYVFWALAKRLGRGIAFNGVPLDMTVAPGSDDLHAMLLRNAPVPFDEIRKRGGEILDLEPVVVAEVAESSGRFEVAPPDVVAELADVLKESPSEDFPLLLSSRRMRDVSNTMFQDFPAIRSRVPFNPAYMHPDAIVAMGFNAGDRVQIVSEHGRIPAILAEDKALVTGVVSMSHCWGALPDDEADYEQVGSSTNLLISTDRDCEPINAMPRMSAIPVRIECAVA